MKIRFTENTKIRQRHDDPQAPVLGIAYQNTILDVNENLLEGFDIEGNNHWWQDKNGWYYWSGKTEVLQFDKDDALPPVVAKPIALPVPDDQESIPDGETRSRSREVPPRAIIDAPPRAIIPETPPRATTPLVIQPSVVEIKPTSELVEVEITGSREKEPPRSREVPPRAIIEVPPPVLETLPLPIVQAGDWALNSRRIPEQWWQEKQLTGRGIKIAILSTGIDTSHPDLAPALSGQFAFSDNDTLEDSHGLGSEAALIALGRGQMAIGVAPQATLLCGKIGPTPGDMTPENLIAALKWAIDNQADVIAMLADFRDLMPEQTQMLEQLISQANAQNIVLLAPSGNSFERKPEVRYPASLNGVLCIGAHNLMNQRCFFSAASKSLDVLAPGEGIRIGQHEGMPLWNQRDTCIATAYAAGIVALVRQSDPTLTTEQIRNILRESATAPNPLTKGTDTEYGYGILNPEALLSLM
ncbi:MAG: S8 family serine peptidase [Saprospiraceae bacterium]|nr:S8 family serine peptidase [Saprospiraceae bacterium]